MIKTCRGCGEPIVGKRSDAVTCSKKCLQVARRKWAYPCVVEECSNPGTGRGLCTGHQMQERRGEFPTLLRSFKKKPNGKPSRTKTSQGYIQMKMPEHPSCNRNGVIMEHRVVMEEVLGRPLVSGENVHHINGVRDDNRPENLELWVTSQPPGQRPEDLVKWAKEILERYDK